jgi:hypothetical protein
MGKVMKETQAIDLEKFKYKEPIVNFHRGHEFSNCSFSYFKKMIFLRVF